jgi:hypothetical protein
MARAISLVISLKENGLPDLVQFASLRAGAIGIFQFFSEVKRTS